MAALLGRLGSFLAHNRETRPRAVRGPVWLALAALVTGAATYALLILLARVLGAVDYADFAVFWSFLVIASFGVFLPVEQDVARRVAGEPGSIPTVLRGAVVVALAYAAALVVVGGLLWSALLARSRPDPALVLALVLICVAQALQFCARGVLSGQVRLSAYAAVVGSDALLRLVIVAGLALLGVRSPGVFAAAVAVSAAVAAAVGWGLLRRRTIPRSAIPDRSRPELTRTRLMQTTGGLIVGALGMQLLLNGGTFVARGLATGSEAALAGHLLAAMTLARVPVFLLQSMQASYLARIAGQARRGDVIGMKHTLLILGVVVGGLATLTVLGGALIGPELIGLVYGAPFVLSRGTTVLIALGVACYVVATVSNDTMVALGRHRTVALAWPLGVAVGLAAVVLGSDLEVRSTLPLIVGAGVAGAVLLTTIVRVTRRIGG